jgi:hypothetical protein
MLIALTLEKMQLSTSLIALTQGCRSDTRKHQELTPQNVGNLAFCGKTSKIEQDSTN